MTGQPPLVVHVIRPEPDGSIGGADLHVLELAAAQTELGLCRSLVLAPGHGVDFGRRAEGLGVPVRPWRSLPRGDRAATFVHTHGYEADLIGLMLVATGRFGKTRPPVVMTCHGIIEPDLRHRVLNAIDRACLRRADVLIGVSTGAVRQLHRIAPGRPVHLVRNGVRAPRTVPTGTIRRVRAQFGARDGDQLVGYVGRLSREKRPDLFLEVAAQMASEQATARFVVVGGGALAGEIASATARSAVEPCITLAGLRHDMDAIFAALDLLVVPSDMENTPRVVHEALTCGVPTVVTSVGDMPFMIRDAAHTAVAPPGDVSALAAAATSLLHAHPALDRSLEDMPQADRTIDHMARAVQQVYTTLVPPSGPGLLSK